MNLKLIGKIVFIILFLSASGIILYKISVKSVGNVIDEEKRMITENDICRDCNVIFISLTNLRADHMGTYGYFEKTGRDTTPNLDKFAKKSIVFNNAFTVASWTLPAMVSLYTSQYPFAHKILDRYSKTEEGIVTQGNPKLSSNIPTLADVLKENGYKTATINAGQDYLSVFGVTSRFDFQSSIFEEANISNFVWSRYGSIIKIAPKSIEFLEENKDQKFFLHIQAYDTHCPFIYPKEITIFDKNYKGNIDFSSCYWTFNKTEPIKIIENGKEVEYYQVKTSNPLFQDKTAEMLSQRDIEHMIALYDGEIFNSDEYIGKILKKIDDLGISNKTMIVFFSEHGDVFGKNGRFMRGGPIKGTFYDDVLKIPLIVYNPKFQAKKVDSLISIMDISPTILNFLDIQKPESFVGQSMVNSIKTDQPINTKILAGSAYSPDKTNPWFRDDSMILTTRDLDWKLIKEYIFYENFTEISYELFNVKSDVVESINLKDKNPKKLKELNQTLNDWLKKDFGIINPTNLSSII